MALETVPKWNFHKIIIGKNGKIVDTFASFTKPSSKKFLDLIKSEIKKLNDKPSKAGITFLGNFFLKLHNLSQSAN